jgi:16S rRNA (cytosine1402-N4)-methyltransferase
MYHNPVMPLESIDSLKIISDGIYVDLTFGGGGHSKLILEKLGIKGRLIAFDQDTDAMKNKMEDNRLLLINQNFKFLKQNLKYHSIKSVNGVFADLGVSSHQFDSSVRGFSIRHDSELDMRMNINSSVNAKNILNEFSVNQLSDIFYHYSDLRNSKQIAELIVRERAKNKITKTSQLNKLLKPFLPLGFENKVLAKVYQALRIEVNNEMEALKEVLVQLPVLVKKGGIISIITYHSVEDRLVKRFIQNGCFDSEPIKNEYGIPIIPFKRLFKFITPSDNEIKNNNRARSAKLRSAVRL